AVVAPAPRGGGGRAASGKAQVEEALRDRIQAAYYRFADGDRAFNAANVEKLFTTPAGSRAGLDPGLGLFSTGGHAEGHPVVVEELTNYRKASAKTSGDDVQDHFGAVPFGWPGDLLRSVAAAMFVDGKLSASDRAGRHFDDPSAAGARGLFGTAAFRTIRLE